jgi:hypothetical protein
MITVALEGGFDFTAADCMGWMNDAGFTSTRAEHPRWSSPSSSDQHQVQTYGWLRQAASKPVTYMTVIPAMKPPRTCAEESPPGAFRAT